MKAYLLAKEVITDSEKQQIDKMPINADKMVEVNNIV